VNSIAYTYGRPVCDAEDATFRTCFAMLRARFAHVSQLSHWAFRMFRTCFAHVSRLSHWAFRTFRACFAALRTYFAGFTPAITHISP
jgi:hypothetical protein